MQKWESNWGEELKRNKRIVDIFNILPNSVGHNNNNCFKSARQEVAFSHLKISIVRRNQIYQQKLLLHCGLETSLVLRQRKFPACSGGMEYITLKWNLQKLIGKALMFWAVCRWHEGNNENRTNSASAIWGGNGEMPKMCHKCSISACPWQCHQCSSILVGPSQDFGAVLFNPIQNEMMESITFDASTLSVSQNTTSVVHLWWCQKSP